MRFGPHTLLVDLKCSARTAIARYQIVVFSLPGLTITAVKRYKLRIRCPVNDAARSLPECLLKRTSGVRTQRQRV